MAVVRNLMVRIGADYSQAEKGMQGAKKSLSRFKRDAEKTTNQISGSRGFGGASAAVQKFSKDVSQSSKIVSGQKGLKGISNSFADLGKTVTSSLSRIQGAKGVGGVVTSLTSLKTVSGGASSGLTGLGSSAASTSSKLLKLAGRVTIVASVIGLLIQGLYSASQPAVQFDSAITRLNMSLKGGSSDYLAWARSMKIAKSSATEMGSTYSVLLSSFIRDNSALTQSTKDLVHASRVTASATGRSIEDVMERMRSGLLGNTEAIEDLGIFVNVSMIESTEAFRKFANGKSWDQLTFQTQQQIRLAAILEQTYKRYGNELQKNVMTKQQGLSEQLKDIKLNLSQAFLPIWDSILPALTSLAEALAYTTEQIARFTYWLRGWDYNQQTQGISDQTDAVSDQSDAYDDLAKDAKAARKELASFDQLNLLGGSSGGSGGKSGGSGGGWSTPGGQPTNTGNIPTFDTPLIVKGKVVFDPPIPPNMGAVATAINVSINVLAAQARLSMADLWSNLQVGAQLGLQGIQSEWEKLTLNLTGQTIPSLTSNILTQFGSWGLDLRSSLKLTNLSLQTEWTTMLTRMKNSLTTEGSNILVKWGNVLDGMKSKIVEKSPVIQTEWNKFLSGLKLGLVTTGVTLGLTWANTLVSMRNNANQYLPTVQQKWQTLVDKVGLLKSPLEVAKSVFQGTVMALKNNATSYLQPIVDLIDKVRNAWKNLQETLTGKSLSAPTSTTNPSTSKSSSGVSGEAIAAGGAAVVAGATALNWNKLTDLLKSAGKGLSSGASSFFAPIDAMVDYLYEAGKDQFGWGGDIPAFATGAVVSSPTLAMVGDNHNARSNPEIIAPQDMMYSTVQAAMSDSNNKVISVLERIAHATESGRSVTVSLSDSEVGSASARHINSQSRRGLNPVRM